MIGCVIVQNYKSLWTFGFAMLWLDLFEAPSRVKFSLFGYGYNLGQQIRIFEFGYGCDFKKWK